MINLVSILKSRDITLPTNVCIVKAMVFPPVVMYWCKSWTTKKNECWIIDAFKLWYREGSLESLEQQGDQTSQSQRKSTLIHWKDWCWSWSSNTLAAWFEELTHWKRPWCWECWGQEEKWAAGDEMVGWHHWLYWNEFEQSLVDGEGQASPVCCSLWGWNSQTQVCDWTTTTWGVKMTRQKTKRKKTDNRHRPTGSGWWRHRLPQIQQHLLQTTNKFFLYKENHSEVYQ